MHIGHKALTSSTEKRRRTPLTHLGGGEFVPELFFKPSIEFRSVGSDGRTDGSSLLLHIT